MDYFDTMTHYGINANAISEGTFAIRGYGPKSGITDVEAELDILQRLRDIAPWDEEFYAILWNCIEEPTGMQATHSWELFEYSLFVMLSLEAELDILRDIAPWDEEFYAILRNCIEEPTGTQLHVLENCLNTHCFTEGPRHEGTRRRKIHESQQEESSSQLQPVLDWDRGNTPSWE